MNERKYSIILADGTVLSNLRRNGTNFVSEEQIDGSLFDGGLDILTISDGEAEIVLRHAELIQQVHYPDNTPPGWYLCFRELTPEERMVSAWDAAQKLQDVPLLLLSGVTAMPGRANSCRRGADGLVVVSVAVAADGPTQAAVLPEGYRPSAAVSVGDVAIHPDGTIWVGGSGIGSTCFYAPGE